MKVEIDVVYPHSKLKTLVEAKPEGQKFAVGERVYIRPIFESSKLHFHCDLITTVKHSYNQAYGDGGASNQYSTEIASWYDECELMSAGDMSIEECRAALNNEFGISYNDMIDMRVEAQANCPLGKLFRDVLTPEVMKDIVVKAVARATEDEKQLREKQNEQRY